MPLLTRPGPPANAAEARQRRQQGAKARAVRTLDNQVNSLVRMHNALSGQIWADPQLTPQEVCDGLDEDAGEVMQVRDDINACITAIAGRTGLTEADLGLIYPTNDYTINPDGTVTVGTGSWTAP